MSKPPIKPAIEGWVLLCVVKRRAVGTTHFSLDRMVDAYAQAIDLATGAKNDN